MVTALLAPLSKERSEITRVAGHQNAILLRRQLQHLRIVERTQAGIGREAKNVVAIFLHG